VDFDEIISKCIKMNLIKGSVVNTVKLELLNVFANLTKDEFVIQETDDKGTVIEKLEKFKVEIQKYSIQTDFYGVTDAKLDFTHANLKRLKEK